MTLLHTIAKRSPPMPARRHYPLLGLALGATVLFVSLTPLADAFIARLLLFYVGVTAAYGLMPYARRGDIPLVAAWVVLLSELAPCLDGELLSPGNVTADAAGVAMATIPIYIARLRQTVQGDMRWSARRSTDACVRRPSPAEHGS